METAPFARSVSIATKTILRRRTARNVPLDSQPQRQDKQNELNAVRGLFLTKAVFTPSVNVDAGDDAFGSVQIPFDFLTLVLTLLTLTLGANGATEIDVVLSFLK